MPAPPSAPARPDSGGIQVAVAVRFRKVRIKPLKRYGAYRGEGTVRLNDAGLGIRGKHVRPLGIRWAIGLEIYAASLLLTAGTLAPGFIPLYFLMEYGLLEEGARLVPWTSVVSFAVDQSKGRIAVETAGSKKKESPLAFSSEQWQEVAQALRTFVPGCEALSTR